MTATCIPTDRPVTVHGSTVAISTNAGELAALFDGALQRVDQRARTLVSHFGVRLVASVKGHAAGRPGPRMVTGDYNRSWALEVGNETSGAFTARAGTNKVQGPRLEFGFQGQDSLGRNYDQPPFPHAGPGFDDVAPDFETAAGRLVDDIMKG